MRVGNVTLAGGAGEGRGEGVKTVSVCVMSEHFEGTVSIIFFFGGGETFNFEWELGN